MKKVKTIARLRKKYGGRLVDIEVSENLIFTDPIFDWVSQMKNATKEQQEKYTSIFNPRKKGWRKDLRN